MRGKFRWKKNARSFCLSHNNKLEVLFQKLQQKYTLSNKCDLFPVILLLTNHETLYNWNFVLPTFWANHCPFYIGRSVTWKQWSAVCKSISMSCDVWSKSIKMNYLSWNMSYGRCSYPALCPLGLSINVVSPCHDHVARHISAPFRSKLNSRVKKQYIAFIHKRSSKFFTMWPVKTQIRLRALAVWSGISMFAR